MLLARAIVLGYPPARLPEGSLLNRKEQAIVAACADALFPPGGPIPLSGTEAGLVAYMDHYLAGLPALPRLLGRLLFHSIEHGPWLFGPRRVRFTRLTAAQRIAALHEMAHSSLYFRRVSFLSMRAMMTMGYLAHPEVAKTMRMVSDRSPFERPRASRPATQEVYA
ncbi:MAG: hypothetical protein QM820_42330 [Minicystis sp.]